jgi:hypothetical protein
LADGRSRLFAKRSPDVLYRVRVLPTLVVEDVSPAAEPLTGYTPDELYAEPALWGGLVHPDDRHLVDPARRDLDAIAQPVVRRRASLVSPAIDPVQLTPGTI